MKTLALPLLALVAASASATTPKEDLEFLVGNWTAKFTRKAEGGKTETVNAKVATKWRLQNTFLEMEETQTTEGRPPTTTLFLMTWDPQRSAYQGYIFTSSVPNFPMEVTGRFEGSKLVFNVNAEDLKVSFTFEKLPDGKYRGGSSIKMGSQDQTESVEYSKADGK